MFIDVLQEFERELLGKDVSQKSVITERLNKINEQYLTELINSKNVVQNSGQRSLLKQVGKK